MRVTNAILVYYTRSVRKIWRFSIRDLSGIISVRKVFLCALLVSVGGLQSPWGAGWQNNAPSLWTPISKSNHSVAITQRIFRQNFEINPKTVLLVSLFYCCGWETSAKQHLPRKQNIQVDILRLEIVRTPNEWVRLKSEILGDRQGKMSLHWECLILRCA